MCEYKFKNTATTATNQPQMFDITGFSPVAVPKNSATGTATAATNLSYIYNIHNTRPLFLVHIRLDSACALR